MDHETLAMALTGYEAEKVKIEAAIANLRAQLGTSNKGGNPRNDASARRLAGRLRLPR